MPAEPVPLIGNVSALVGAEHRAQPVAGLVEQGDELGVEVAEHRAGERVDDLGVRVARAGAHQDAVGQRHRAAMVVPPPDRVRRERLGPSAQAAATRPSRMSALGHEALVEAEVAHDAARARSSRRR